jgi:hypothetical protein
MKHSLHLSKVSAILFFLFTTASAFAQQTDFSGTWQINKSKTDFGQAPEWVLPRAFKVDQSGKGLTIDVTMLSQALEEKHYTEKVAFDGTTSTTTTTSGNTERDSLTWDANKTGLTLMRHIENPSGALIFNDTEQWSLTDDSKTLLIDRQVKQGDGAAYGFKIYYDKH